MDLPGSSVEGRGGEPALPPVHRALVVGAGGSAYALNLAQVIEIMRPLPVQQVAGAPEMVAGLSIIRGVPVPVVVLSDLFHEGGAGATRFVVVRAGKAPVALAVDAVLGFREFAPAVYQGMPLLLRDAARDVVDSVAALDSELFLVLDASRIVPAGFLESLPGQEL